MAANFFRRGRAVVWIIGVIAISVLTLLGQSSQRLYLVSGLAATNAFPIGNPLSLIAIDEGQSTAVKVLDIGPASLVLADHERKLFLAAGFGDRLTLLDMRTPTVPQKLPYFGPSFLCTPTYAATDVGCVDVLGLQPRLSGMNLNGSTAGEKRNVPVDYFRFARIEGTWSPADADYAAFLIYKNGKLLFHEQDESTDFGIPLPRDIQPFERAKLIWLRVSNDDMVVLDCFRQPSPGTEIHDLLVYDRQLGSWQNPNLDAGPSVRGFGPWIATASWALKRASDVAAHEADLKKEPQSPGAEFRQRNLNPNVRAEDHASLDYRFQFVPFQFTGDLSLYNIRTRKSYRIRTGQGDSEILLVDGSIMYYRVNDTLYKAIIGQQPELIGTRILSSPDVQLAHWAFLGS